MADVVDALVLDLLEWVGFTPRCYPEVMEAWRTSCPRLPVWEDANDRGFIDRHYEPGRGEVILVSASGLEYLQQHRTPPATSHLMP
jgi:D-3-phosphoglycerate dehydrogenase